MKRMSIVILWIVLLFSSNTFSKQIVENIKAEVKPINFGIVPLLSMNGLNSKNITNYLSYNLLCGKSGSIRGYSTSLITNITLNDMFGYQSGLKIHMKRKVIQN